MSGRTERVQHLWIAERDISTAPAPVISSRLRNIHRDADSHHHRRSRRRDYLLHHKRLDPDQHFGSLLKLKSASYLHQLRRSLRSPARTAICRARHPRQPIPSTEHHRQSRLFPGSRDLFRSADADYYRQLANPTIYYTLDGSTPTTASAIYSSPLSIPVASETVQAIAFQQPGLSVSPSMSATYTIQPAYSINFTQGFTQAQGPMQFNGSTDLDDFRLQLTNGGLNEAGSAFYATPVNVQSFTTNFTFQLSNPAGNGITFTIQNVGPSALGSSGAGLGYARHRQSVAIKFELYNSAGEGPDSTGLYIDGAMPTVPAIYLTGTGIDLHSGDKWTLISPMTARTSQ